MTRRDEDDAFGGSAIERAMINKIGKVQDNFRVYSAGWIGRTPDDWKSMSITGALFEPITRGPRKGRMLKPVVGTKQTVTVTREELAAAKAQLDAAAAEMSASGESVAS